MEKKARYQRKVSQRQSIALQLISNGSTPRSAMLKAGYSMSSASNPGRVLFGSPAVVSVLNKMQGQLNREGLTTGFMVKKYGELVRGGEEHTQLEVLRELRKLWGIDKELESGKPGLTRRVTLEEYLGDTTKPIPLPGEVTNTSN